MVSEARRPFDLQQGPLLRAFLLPIQHDRHFLLLLLHHIITDAWSTDLLLSLLLSYYQACRSGNSSLLPSPPPIYYADFALWQRSYFSSELLAPDLAYWTHLLAGAPASLDLPTDTPRSSASSPLGAALSFALSEELSTALRSLAHQEGITLFMLLLASFALLLARYSRQDDLVIGTPIAGRSHPNLDDLLGLFLNTLALRFDLSGDPSVSQFLHRVRSLTLDAYSHQDLPFEQVIEALHLAPSSDLHPLFQTMFVFQNQPSTRLQTPDLTITPLTIEISSPKFDLTLLVKEHEKQLLGSLEYRCDLWNQETMQRFLQHWQRVLRAMVDDPHQSLSHLSLLSPQEMHTLLQEWNPTPTPLADLPIPHVHIEAQAARTPDAPALRFEGLTLSYRQMNQQANQLAHRLRLLGVGPETFVAFFLPRSSHQILALLAILKAGAAYLPLDPDYPQERIAFMLRHCNAPLLLTLQALLPALPSSSCQILCLDTDPTLALLSHDNLPWTGDPEQAMYVLYTSGSTGLPKGSINSHRNLYNYLLWQLHVAAMTPQDRVLLKTPVTFDAAALEVFTPLMVGATMVIAPPESHRDGASLRRLITEEAITITHFVPSVLQRFLEDPLVHQCQSLRYIVSGGEPLSSHLHHRFTSLLKARLHNQYGPTETSVTSTAWEVLPDDHPTPTVPIGRPLPNTQLYILDPHLHLAPIGVPGELYIGGLGLARGYAHRPDLTAERFLPHPFSELPGARLYRTGDLARFRPDGTLEFLGRLDGQVKLRGQRLELGEIETVLRRLPQVQEAAVLLQEIRGEPHLVAYLLSPQKLDETTLRSFLHLHLPAYMLPSFFVPLQTFPLTPNGKLDRRALPLPDLTHPRELVSPRTPTEVQVAALWSEVLGLESISIHDDFFALGGHSLLATRLVLLLREQVKRDVPLRLLFEKPTLAQFAQAIDDLSIMQIPTSDTLFTPPVQSNTVLVPFNSTGTSTPIFFVHPVGGEIFRYLNLAQRLTKTQPFYGLRFPFEMQPSVPPPQMEDLVTCYLQAIRQVQPHGPYVVGGWSLGGCIAYAMTDRLRQQGEEVSTLVLIDTKAPIPAMNEKEKNEEIYLMVLKDLALIFHKTITDLVNSPDFIAQTLQLLEHLSEHQHLPYILSLGQELSVLPPDLTIEDMERLFFPFKANTLALRGYTAPLLADQHILLFKAIETSNEPGGETLGWQALSRQAPVVISLPGNHYTIMEAPVVETLAKFLETLL